MVFLPLCIAVFIQQNLQDPTLEGPPANTETLEPLAVQHLDNRLYIKAF